MTEGPSSSGPTSAKPEMNEQWARIKSFTQHWSKLSAKDLAYISLFPKESPEKVCHVVEEVDEWKPRERGNYPGASLGLETDHGRFSSTKRGFYMAIKDPAILEELAVKLERVARYPRESCQNVVDLDSIQGTPPAGVDPREWARIPCPLTGCPAVGELCSISPERWKTKNIIFLVLTHPKSTVPLTRYDPHRHYRFGKIRDGRLHLEYALLDREESLKKIAWVYRQKLASALDPSPQPLTLSPPRHRRLPVKVAGLAGVALWRLVLEALM